MALDDQDRAPVLRLDDDFVKGAKFKEGTADERRRQSERQQRKAARQRARKIRQQWRRPRRFQPKDWIIPALFVVAAMYIIKAGPFRHPARPSLRSAGLVTTTTLAPGETTSTTFTLERLNYRPGDCVKWDQRKDGPGTRDTSIVPCDQLHLIEITGRTVVPDAPAYPPESEWTRLTQSGDCAAQAKAYLGGVLDPYGRFGIGAIHPSLESWNDGDREMWCGLEAHSQAADADPDVSELFTGSVHSQPQALLWPTGSCLGGGDGKTTFDGTVPCTAPHLYEVVGTVNAATRFTTPPPGSSNQWSTRLGADCAKVAAARLGRLPAGVDTAVFPIDPASWAAGRRTTECAVARFDPKTGNPTSLTAPLALQQKAISG